MNKPLKRVLRRNKLQKQRYKPITGYDKSSIDAPPIKYKTVGNKI